MGSCRVVAAAPTMAGELTAANMAAAARIQARMVKTLFLKKMILRMEIPPLLYSMRFAHGGEEENDDSPKADPRKKKGKPAGLAFFHQRTSREETDTSKATLLTCWSFSSLV